MNRREFVQKSTTAALLSAIGAQFAGCHPGSFSQTPSATLAGFEFAAWSIDDIAQALRSRKISAKELTNAYTSRIDSIDKRGPALKSVLKVNPDALRIARELDEELLRRGPRGPLHGVPILLKDNIDTTDRMPTTAGSLALADSFARRDAFLAARLRAAGAVILGKTNLSEWANFRGARSISGWSGIGGQTRNPHVLDRSPSGSSSGSAAAVAASLCAAAVGTETDGSIISPASFCGVVGLKPTVGLVSRSGVIPISSSQDTAGPMARSVMDAAILADVLKGRDELDPATSGIPDGMPDSMAAMLRGATLKGRRIGVARKFFGFHPGVDQLMERVIQVLRKEGAEVIDPVVFPGREELGNAEYEVMLHEFKAGLNAYLGALPSSAPVRSLEQLINFNHEHQEQELAFFGQQTLIAALEKPGLDDARYLEARKRCVKWSREQGIDAVVRQHSLDAIMAPSGGPAHTVDHLTGDRWLGGSSTPAAVAGYPSITLPCGDLFGLPIGVSFFGAAWTEPRILQIAHAYERANPARRQPKFLRTLELGSLV